MGVVKKVLWIVVALCAIVGGLQTISGLMGAETVMDQCAASAMGMSWCVIPYCLARAVSQYGK